jgi:very-short-patch-repair endonuclease/predicted transcriptional regulator of viral defense system
MRQELAKRSPDLRIATLAARQHGVITRAQLVGLGLDDKGIQRRACTGRLHRLYRGVYAVGHTRLTTEGRYLSAVLARGERAALSHKSAAVLWKLLPERGPRIDVTVPSGGTRMRRGAVIVHRSPLPTHDVTLRAEIPVTSPVRTLIDLADCCSRRELERTIDEAHFLRLDLTTLRPLRGRRGAALLATVLDEHEPGTTRTKSDFEELMLALCRDHGLPKALVNQIVEGYEVDFVWPRARLIVEADSWSAHGRRSTFESDRLRDAALATAGWRVIRITWRRLLHEPHVVAAQLARLIAAGA